MGYGRNGLQLGERQGAGRGLEIEWDGVEVEAVSRYEGTNFATKIKILLIAKGGQTQVDVKARGEGKIGDGNLQVMKRDRGCVGKRLIEVINDAIGKLELMN